MNWNLQKQADGIKFKDRNDKYKYSIAKKTLDCLISYCDEDGETIVGLDTISKRICTCIQTIYNHFEILSNLEILKTQRMGKNIVKIIDFECSTKVINNLQQCSNDVLISLQQCSNKGSNDHSNQLEAKKDKISKEKDNSTISDTQPKGNVSDSFNDEFNDLWKNHSDRLKQLKTKDGNPRTNSNKSKTLDYYILLRKKYSYDVLACYVRKETLRDTPKELLNLFGKSADTSLLNFMNKQDKEYIYQGLSSSDKTFLEFMNHIIENI